MTQQQTKEKLTYEDCLNKLQGLLNSKKHINKNDFNDCLRVLAIEFKQSISTKFLKSLFIGKTNREQTFRIAYLLRVCNLSTRKQNRYFKEWIAEKYHIEITEYQHTKGLIYSSPCELTQEEKEQITQIKEIEEKTGIELFNYAEFDFNERQRKRNAIYKLTKC